MTAPKSGSKTFDYCGPDNPDNTRRLHEIVIGHTESGVPITTIVDITDAKQAGMSLYDKTATLKEFLSGCNGTKR